MENPNAWTYGSILIEMDSDEIEYFKNTNFQGQYTIEEDRGVWIFLEDFFSLIEK